MWVKQGMGISVVIWYLDAECHVSTISDKKNLIPYRKSLFAVYVMHHFSSALEKILAVLL